MKTFSPIVQLFISNLFEHDAKRIGSVNLSGRLEYYENVEMMFFFFRLSNDTIKSSVIV